MPDLQPPTGKKRNLAIFLALLAGCILGYTSSEIIGFLSGIGPEYETADAIREITEFVRQNESWPTGWSDLGQHPRKSVRIDWQLNLGTCDRHDVMTSVSPSTDGFYTYPHAERQLGELWQLVSKIQNEQSGRPGNRTR